ncbi:MAG TPA: hypothetical protein VM165_16470 [Planctomycetaceae bacterium]|nr:hypothetical protein [Planctomycetaceae bacterium]
MMPGAEATRAPQSPPYTITISPGRRTEIPEEALAIELVDVNDTRCAVEVQCVWAGVAELTLRVSKGGGAAQSIVVGTLPPSPGNPSTPRTYGPYGISLLNLEPPNSMTKPVAQSQYRATLKVTKSQ